MKNFVVTKFAYFVPRKRKNSSQKVSKKSSKSFFEAASVKIGF